MKKSQKRGAANVILPVVAVAIVIGLAGRVLLAWLGVTYGYYGDHCDNIDMGLTAARDRVLWVYSVESQEDMVGVWGTSYGPGGALRSYRQAPQAVNYPPLGIVAYWLQAGLLKAFDPTVEANTFLARLVMSGAAVLAELVTALGLYLIGRDLFGRTAGVVAACVAWLFPPLAMDSSFWGQTDALMMAPAMFAIWLMLRRRWIGAGVLMGAAVLLKPQAMLLGPVALFAAWAVPTPDDALMTFRRFAARIAKMLGTAAAAAFVIALPWTIADGFKWFDWAFLHNFRIYPATTSKAFNVWYLDVLRLDAAPTPDALDSTARWIGLTKDTWGKVFTLAAMASLAWLCLRRYARTRLAVVVFAALSMWSAFMWSTRMHERYILYCVPLVILCAVRLRRLWPAVAGLMFVGIASLSWHIWMDMPAGAYTSRVIDDYHDALSRDHEQRFALTPEHLRPAPPTRQDARTMAEADYRGFRAAAAPRERFVTLLSIASYAFAVLAGVVAFKLKRAASP